jgi:hypothetical protein
MVKEIIAGAGRRQAADKIKGMLAAKALHYSVMYRTVYVPHRAAGHWPLAGQLVKISLRDRPKSCWVTSETIASAIFQPP